MLLIDTDAISHLARGVPRGALVEKLSAVPPQRRYISAITLAEILYGMERKKVGQRLRQRIAAVLQRIEVLPFDDEAAKVYARIRAQMEANGTPLPHADLQIAAIAMSRGLTLLTGNERHFGRIRGLKLEVF